ncbi:aquaporin TIP4-2 [Lipomyces kononenkoae]
MASKSLEAQPRSEYNDNERLRPAIQPFAGRIGGNQTSVLDPSDRKNAEALKRVPDAAPHIRLRQSLDLRVLLDTELWRIAFMEAVGTFLFDFVTIWIAAHPPPSSSVPVPPIAGIFATSTFLGPLVGGITNWLFLTLFIYALGPVSGAHLNPTITISTFCAGLITLPRLILYVTAQVSGATLAGLAVRSAYGSGNYVVGGCDINTMLVPVNEAFVLEYVFTQALLFFAFGTALDPRQTLIYSAALAPWLVGLALGLLSFGSSFTRPGYGGASMNPARCFGAYVGIGFPTYHWIHWVGPIAASIVNGVIYHVVPPWVK